MQGPLRHCKVPSWQAPARGECTAGPCRWGRIPSRTPARRHATHTPAAGTRHAGGHRPRRGSCRFLRWPSWHAAAPGLPARWLSPPAAPRHLPVSIAPVSWEGEQAGDIGGQGWRDRPRPTLETIPSDKSPGVHGKDLPGVGTGARQGHICPHLSVLHTWRDTHITRWVLARCATPCQGWGSR